MKDYEQLYYDSQYEIKCLKQRIEELETDLKFVKCFDKKNIAIQNQIIREIRNYINKGGTNDKRRIN